MKCNYFFITAIWIFIVAGCGQSKNEGDETGSSTPGPITESDKSRYNLNAPDEVIYGTMDSIQSDSTAKDSTKHK